MGNVQLFNGQSGYNYSSDAYITAVMLFPSEFEITTKKEEKGTAKAYNICEVLAENEINATLSRNSNLCKCSQCYSDIMALSLRTLPALYVTSDKNSVVVDRIAFENRDRVSAAVRASIKTVQTHPRKECKKLITFINKTADNIEWVN